jgi:hypothetical protein
MGVVDRLCQSIVFGLCLGVPAVGAAAQDMPPLPKPGPEHQLFKEDEGTWDAKVEVFPGPGAAPMVSKGVEINTVGCGGLCLITDFKGEVMPGQVFHGHGTAAYDPQKKKYVGSWTDSMSRGMAVSEATYDPATKRVTGAMEGADPSGKMVRSRTVVDYKGATRVFSIFNAGPDGKEAETMRITYTRRP